MKKQDDIFENAGARKVVGLFILAMVFAGGGFNTVFQGVGTAMFVCLALWLLTLKTTSKC